MSEPMLIPKSLLEFRHPHIGRPFYGDLIDPTGFYCITKQPPWSLELIRYWHNVGETSMRVLLSCGAEVEWELPDA